MPVGKARNALDTLTRRIDVNGDKSVDEGELTKFVKDAGVGGGLIGALKVGATVDEFMKRFDADGDGHVPVADLEKQLAALLPPSVSAEIAKDPHAAGKALDAFIAKAGGPDGKVGGDQLRAFIEKELKAQKVGMAGQKAEIATKLALHAFDGDGDHAIVRADLEPVANAVAARLLALKK